MTRAVLASLLPEIFREKDPLDKGTIELLNREMMAHNAALDHGQPIQSAAGEPQRARPRFSSLNEYVLHMHSDKILLVLEPLVKFGERVVPLIREDETARAWFLNEHILIQSRDWRALAGRVVDLVTQLGLLTAEDGSSSPRSKQLRVDNTMLFAAGRRAVEIYGEYSRESRADTKPRMKKRISQSGGRLGRGSTFDTGEGSTFDTGEGQLCSGREDASRASSAPGSPAAGDRHDSHKHSKPTLNP